VKKGKGGNRLPPVRRRREKGGKEGSYFSVRKREKLRLYVKEGKRGGRGKNL